MKRRQIAILSCILTLVLAHTSPAQTIDLSLNLHYNDSGNTALGGNWQLVAKTTSLNGISLVNAILTNVNVAGISYPSGIGAMLDGGNPFVSSSGTFVEVLYAQDLSNPASVVTDVGRGAGTPGNLAIDPLNEPSWNNAALIATGTFGAMTPAFAMNLDTPPDSTAGNVLGTNTPPFFSADAAVVTTIVRDSLPAGPLLGDYNLNGTVDAADYVVWRHTLGAAGPGLAADGSGNNLVDSADYDIWKSRFGLSSGAATGASPGMGL